MKGLFTTALLFSLPVLATTSAEWSQVPIYNATTVQTGLSPAERKVVAKIGRGSDTNASVSDLIRNEVWSNQSEMNDALFRALGQYSTDFDLYDSSDFKLELELTPTRRILFENSPPEVSRQNGKTVMTADSNKPSRFLVINTLTSKLRSDFTIADIGSESDFGIKADAGFQIGYITRDNTPRMLADAKPVAMFEGLNLRGRGEEAKRSGVMDQLAKAAGKLFDGVERGVQKTAHKFIDEDSADVFFSGLFDPFRLLNVLPVRTSELKSKMRTGDILTLTLFVAGGPDIDLQKDVFRTSIERYYRAAYHLTIFRKDEHNFLVRPKILVRRGWDITPIEVAAKFDIGIANINFTPMFYTIDKGREVSLETVLEFDTATQSGSDGLDAAITFNFRKAKDLLDNKVAGVSVNQSTLEKLKETHSRFYFNVGFAQLKREKRSEVKSRVTVNDDGSKDHSWSADVRALSYTRFVLPKYKYETAAGSQTMLQSNLNSVGNLLSEIDPSTLSNGQLSLSNMTTFSDISTTRAEFRKILKYVQLASNDATNAVSETAIATIERAYDKKDSLPLAVTVITALNADILGSTLKLPEDQFYRILAETVLVNPDQPLMTLTKAAARKKPSFGISDRRGWAHLQNYEEVPFLTNCQVKSAFGPKYKEGETVDCRTVWNRVKHIGTGYKEARYANTDEARLGALVNVIRKMGVNPLANVVMANAYTAATGQNAPVKYYVKIEPGPGIIPYSNANSTELSKVAFQRNRVFEGTLQITPSDTRVKGGELFTRKDSHDGLVYASVTSPIQLKSDQRLTFWLQNFIRLKRDIPINAAVANNLVPQEILSDSIESLYRYEVALPAEVVEAMRTNEKSELHVRIENSNGEPLSEFGRFRIRAKNLD